MTIGDHAAIGDGRSVALISRAGDVTWLCWPHMDSPSLFGALLDAAGGGRWRMAPRGPIRGVTRRYLPHTNVLETRLRTPHGTLRLTDLMPIATAAERRHHLFPESELLRVAECEHGSVELEMVCDPRPNYARGRVRWQDGGPLGWRATIGSQLLTLHTDVPLQRTNDGRLTGSCVLTQGHMRSASLTLAGEGPTVMPPLGAWSRAAITRTAAWWIDWASRITYHGPYREAVIRSALLLKLLIFSPSGAILASATTSLPERIGGDLNWDYRYCWLRDASFAARALLALGYRDEVEAFGSWLLHATRLTHPRLGVVYRTYGTPLAPEQILRHLSGHRRSRPVRIGNAASAQQQLDLYGEVIDAVAQTLDGRLRVDRETQRTLQGFGRYVCDHWQEPDAGLWESRDEPARYTHSLVLCWVALDRLLALHGRGLLPGAPSETWRQVRAEIRETVETRAWNAQLGSYVRTLDGHAVDASLLLLSWYRYAAPEAPRMQATYAAVARALTAGPGLVYRNRDAREGAFHACGLWAAEYLARGGGSLLQARASLDAVLQHGNDVGLFAEETDPTTGEALGNFPMAYTHLGLINAALALDERMAA